MAHYDLHLHTIIHTENKLNFLELNKHRIDIVVDDKPMIVEELLRRNDFIVCMPVWNYNAYIVSDNENFFRYNKFFDLYTFLSTLKDHGADG